MTLTESRSLVREYFNVSDASDIDEILCAALRSGKEISRFWSWWEEQMSEEQLRAKLSSTRALFANSFGLDKRGCPRAEVSK